jgi:hypothetical protein
MKCTEGMSGACLTERGVAMRPTVTAQGGADGPQAPGTAAAFLGEEETKEDGVRSSSLREMAPYHISVIPSL